MRYTYKTRFGVFAITPGTNGRWNLAMGDEGLGNYASPELAAGDVATQHSSHDGWDSHAGPNDIPEGLNEWERIT